VTVVDRLLAVAGVIAGAIVVAAAMTAATITMPAEPGADTPPPPCTNTTAPNMPECRPGHLP